jgi:hypothetical protein
MRPKERWRELENRIYLTTADDVLVETDHMAYTNSYRNGFDRALRWVEEQIKELEDK